MGVPDPDFAGRPWFWYCTFPLCFVAGPPPFRPRESFSQKAGLACWFPFLDTAGLYRQLTGFRHPFRTAVPQVLFLGRWDFFLSRNSPALRKVGFLLCLFHHIEVLFIYQRCWTRLDFEMRTCSFFFAHFFLIVTRLPLLSLRADCVFDRLWRGQAKLLEFRFLTFFSPRPPFRGFPPRTFSSVQDGTPFLRDILFFCQLMSWYLEVVLSLFSVQGFLFGSLSNAFFLSPPGRRQVCFPFSFYFPWLAVFPRGRPSLNVTFPSLFS